MSVATELDRLRASQQGFRAAILGDLSSGLTLSVSASEKRPQEQLDAVIARARTLLNGGPAMDAAAALAGREEQKITRAVILSGKEIQVFIRSPVDECDVLAGICSAETDLSAAVDEAGSTLVRIAGET